MQLKKIALAALAAVSFAPAFAAVNTSDAPELVFMAWNSKGSYSKDLGVQLSNLNGVNTFDFAGAKWNDFLALNGTNTQWTVASVQVNNPDGFDLGDIHYVAAFSTHDFTVINQRSNEGTLQMREQFRAMALATPGQANHELSGPAGSLGDLSLGWANFADGVPSNNEIGTTAKFADIYTSNDDGGANAIMDTFGAAKTANFTGTTLTITTPVAAIPEPSTYALLMGGLLAVGFVARRRQA